MSVIPVGQTHPETPAVHVERGQVEQSRVAEHHGEQQQQNDVKAQQEWSARNFEEAIDQLKKTAHIFGRRFHFKLHEELQEYFVQIIDPETNKVVNEIPPEKILNLVAEIRKLVGLLVNKRA